jgi:hypothetical protein
VPFTMPTHPLCRLGLLNPVVVGGSGREWSA